MSDWKLTIKDIKEMDSPDDLEMSDLFGWDKAVAKVAQRKLMQWLHEPCCKHDAGMLRLGCPECWRELRKEVGLE